MMSNALPPLRPDGAARALGGLRHDATLFRDRQGATNVAKPQKRYVQTGEKAQLACSVLERFRQRKPTLEFGARPIGVPPG